MRNPSPHEAQGKGKATILPTARPNRSRSATNEKMRSSEPGSDTLSRPGSGLMGAVVVLGVMSLVTGHCLGAQVCIRWAVEASGLGERPK
ncbi:hypothetical protein Micbo1qcDRAFT_155751, partial [Microdochium bolleyi]